jgi:hypothetical protein
MTRKELKKALKDILDTFDDLDGHAIAHKIISRRADEAHKFCEGVPGQIGKHVWHVVLDEAIRLRAKKRAKR